MCTGCSMASGSEWFRERLCECIMKCRIWQLCMCSFFFQAEDGIRYLVRSRGLGDVYKRQGQPRWTGPGGDCAWGAPYNAVACLNMMSWCAEPELSLIHI